MDQGYRLAYGFDLGENFLPDLKYKTTATIIFRLLIDEELISSKYFKDLGYTMDDEEHHLLGITFPKWYSYKKETLYEYVSRNLNKITEDFKSESDQKIKEEIDFIIDYLKTNKKDIEAIDEYIDETVKYLELLKNEKPKILEFFID